MSGSVNRTQRIVSVAIIGLLACLHGAASAVPPGEQREVFLDSRVLPTDWLVSANATGNALATSSTKSGVPPDCTIQPFTGADDCADVNIHNLSVGPVGSPTSVTISGDNTGATSDCFGPTPIWWEAFTIAECADVTIDLCCTEVPAGLFIVLQTECNAGCGDTIFRDFHDFTACGEGDNNISMTFLGLAAGTYYYPVSGDPPNGAYQVHISAEQGQCVGSCCDTSTGTCTEDVNDFDCAGPNDSFLLDGSCCDAECSTTPGVFDSFGITLLSNLTFADFPGPPHLGNEVWGYVAPSGREYAIMGFSTGTGFVEITDPVNPVVVGFIDGFPVDQAWRDMAVFNQHAYIVTDGDGMGLQIVDLSDIDNGNVTLANTTDLGVGFVTAHNVFVNEDTGFLYLPLSNLNSANGFTVFDLNVDPVNPPIAGAWTGSRCHDVQIVSYTGPDLDHVGKEIALCFAENNGLRIVDVTNKAAMVELSFLIYPNTTYCHQGWMTDDSLFVLVGDELDEAGDPDVSVTTTYVVDISDLDTPVLHTTYTNNLCAIDHNLMVRGDRSYQANYSTGLRVFDISDINAVTEVAFFDTRPEDNIQDFLGLWGVFTDFPSKVIVASDRQRGLFVFCDGTEDCDGSGVPDACEQLADSNDNGVPDVCEAADPEISFVPIRTAPLGSPAGTVGDQLTPQFNPGLGCWEVLTLGGVEIDLDLQATGWGNTPGSPTLGAIQATVVPAGYVNGVGGALNPKGWPGSPADGAYQADKRCQAGGDLSPCTGPFDSSCNGGANGSCEDADNWVMPPCALNVAAIITPTLNYVWGSLAKIDCVVDDGSVKTMGGLILEVPADAAGTYVIALDPDIKNSFMATGTAVQIPGVAFTPACITIIPSVEPPVLPGVVDGIDHDIRKQRFLSINPNNPKATTRMRLLLLDNGCSVTGRQCTDDESCTVCNPASSNAGDACDNNNQCDGAPGPVGGLCVVSGETCEEQSPPVVLGFILDPVISTGVDAPPNTVIAAVGADPGFRVWDETLVHITDCEVAPNRVYGIEVESVDTPGLYSEPLDMRTSISPPDKDWGDITGKFTGTEWTAGNLLVAVDDVNAIIKFLSLDPNAPHVTRCEMVSANGPLFNNMDVNADELAQIIRCFAGEKYPPLPMVLGGYPDLQAGGLLTDCTGN